MSDLETSSSNLKVEEDMPSLLSIGDGAWDSDKDEKGDRISDIEADDEESDEKEVARPSP